MARDYIIRMIEQLATMLAALINRRRAGEVIEAREDLENTSVRTIGFTLSEIKMLAPEEVAKILDRSGALRLTRALILSELLRLDAEWHQEDRTSEQLLPNYVHAFCLVADSLDSLSLDEQPHFRARLAFYAEKLGELREHPYLNERLSKLEIPAPAQTESPPQ
ncbi:MAG TPA: hypothetical protein VI282_07255 [Verrucomicrobiae bacterium]